MKYIDIHGQINFPDYDADREAVIRRAREAGVGIITVGNGLESSLAAVALAENHPDMWAIVGIHPNYAHESKSVAEFEALRSLAEHPNVVAIGECGLDYFRSQPEYIAAQHDIFARHIELANELNKPLMLHIRNAASAEAPSAYQEALAILKKSSKVRADFHFFAGTLQDARDIVAAGHSISFTTVITFARNYDEVIKNIPLEHLMSETDCPFVAPASHRGKRNEPVYVIEAVQKIAEIRGQEVEVVAAQLLENARKFFFIKS